MSYYRTFLNRFNLFDGDIPGNDYQFPVSIEGVLGYNNAIQLAQPMHMQDLKYFRDPLYAYGDWVSAGESSKCTAFTDNPGNTANWNNNIQQWIGAEAWQAYLVHGGERAILRNLRQVRRVRRQGPAREVRRQPQPRSSNTPPASTPATTPTPSRSPSTTPPAPAATRSAARRTAPRPRSGTRRRRSPRISYSLLGESAKAAEMTALADTLKRRRASAFWDRTGQASSSSATSRPAT